MHATIFIRALHLTLTGPCRTTMQSTSSLFRHFNRNWLNLWWFHGYKYTFLSHIPLKVTTHADTGLKQFDMYPFDIFLTLAWMTPLPTCACRTGQYSIPSRTWGWACRDLGGWSQTATGVSEREKMLFSHTPSWYSFIQFGGPDRQSTN